VSDRLTDGTDAPLSLDPVVRRAHRRWQKCHKWESTARANWMMDIKFDAGDAYNNYQWPVEIYEDRGATPSLTVNETHRHNLHIINEAAQNKASVEYRPTGGGATKESAEVMEGLYRHIANVSNTQMGQGVAISFQVRGGLGFTIVESDYVDPNPKPTIEAFNQEIRVRGAANPMGVYLDCDAQEIDGSDARYGFEFTDRPKDEVIEQYPDLRGSLTQANAVDGEDAGWIRDDHVREAKYYEVKEDKDELIADEEGTVIYRSQAPAQLLKKWEAEAEANGAPLRRRPVIRKSCKCHLIIGNQVVETTDLPGTSVPIIPWVGEVRIIDKHLDRVGHTRCMISAQQMVNYNWSASVEYGALQTKTPWQASVEAVGDYTSYYQNANTEKFSWLPWVERGPDGKQNTKPERIQPPAAAPAFLEGVNLARQFMMSASGQYEAELGAPGNEKSGKAINERQRQSDRSTYHFVDYQALAIRRQGQIVKEWIPVIYDTQRIAKIIGSDDQEGEVLIDPTSDVAHKTQQINGAIQRVLNPSIGSYEVVSDVGPDYATQRQEAFNAIVQILTQAPQLIDKIGDLLFRVADFPMADEIAERMKPGLPREAQKAIDELQKQLAARNKLLGEAMQALSEERLKVKAKDANADIDAYDADTKRLAALSKALPLDPQGLRILVHQLVQEALANPLNGVEAATAPDLAASATSSGQTNGTGYEPLRQPSPQQAIT
jgi:hypothetical protein